MIVVGVGCGPGFLTQYAIECIRGAKEVYGSQRAIDLARVYLAEGCQVSPIQDYSKLAEIPEDAVLLSTGDPMLAGLGHYGTEVVPGISSMQLAFARLRLPLAKAVVVDAHGREHGSAVAEAVEEVGRGRIPFILTEPGFDILPLARLLCGTCPHCKIVSLEDLGYINEVISVGTPEHPPRPSSKLFSLMVVKL